MSESKYDHVRNAKQTRPHTCHWPGCNLQVRPAFWGCSTHWFRLPKDIRDEIWRTYTEGQEERGDPSEAYLNAVEKADAWIREHGGGPATSPARKKGGFTKAEIARRIGFKAPALQFGRKRVAPATARRIRKFFDAVMAE